MTRNVMAQQAEVLLRELAGTDAFERDVREHVVRLLPEGEPTVARVAAALATSPRTLQRRLTERGIRFRDLVDGARRRIADARLRDPNPNASIAEVAQGLGFSDQSAFQRSFKRWTGETPRRYRVARR